jgi:ankyrin repeat protein
VAAYLLSKGANILAANVNGSTTFHMAAGAGKQEICRLLIEFGFKDFFLTDSDRQTPIDLALGSGYKDMASKIALWSTIDICREVS